MVFKETNFNCQVTKNTSDTMITFYSYTVEDSISIEQIDYLTEESVKFLPFHLKQNNDSVILSCFNPLSHKYVFKYLYPVNKRDTLTGTSCYKLRIDSFADLKTTRKYLNECYADGVEYDITYRGDTSIDLDNYRFDCYIISQHYSGGMENDTGGVEIIKTVLIDKILLFPVDEKEYRYFRHHLYGRHIPLNTWLLVKHLKLIVVDSITSDNSPSEETMPNGKSESQLRLKK